MAKFRERGRETDARRELCLLGNIGALSRCHARDGDPGAEVSSGIISRGVTIRERADREKLCVNTERERERVRGH